MKPGFFSYLKSYFVDVLIEQTESEYHDQLDLLLVKGRYQLCTANAIYSFADKYSNFYDSFRKIDLDRIPSKDVLLLGFGLGSIPYMLENNFRRSFRYTGIEIDEEIVYLASKYVLDELQSNIELIQTDAGAFLSNDDQQYGMIAMDIFFDDEIPSYFESLEFCELMNDRLFDGGLVLYNRLSYTKPHMEATEKYFSEVFKKVFPQAGQIKLSGNVMLVSDVSYLGSSE